MLSNHGSNISNCNLKSVIGLQIAKKKFIKIKDCDLLTSLITLIKLNEFGKKVDYIVCFLLKMG